MLKKCKGEQLESRQGDILWHGFDKSSEEQLLSRRRFVVKRIRAKADALMGITDANWLTIDHQM